MPEEQAIICSSCGGPGKELHGCPFAEEINDNYSEEFCTCCDECRQNCCDDI